MFVYLCTYARACVYMCGVYCYLCHREAKAERAAAAKKRKRKKYVLIGIGAAVGATVIG